MEDGMGGNMAKKSLILSFNMKIETYSPFFFLFSGKIQLLFCP